MTMKPARAAWGSAVPIDESDTPGAAVATRLAGDDGRGLADLAVERAAVHFRAAFESLGLDMADPNLEGTDRRVARSFRELFAGLRAGGPPELRTFPNPERYQRMVAVTDIPFHSVCAHHLLPFFGRAHVAYVPKDRIVGLSKLARVVEFYARRPQIQERMTMQVAALIEERLRPEGTMVVVQARHFCMEMRGVAKAGATTTTSAVRGAFEQEPTRQEFLGMLRAPHRTEA
jgi:GTP cyclohydrolase I